MLKGLISCTDQVTDKRNGSNNGYTGSRSCIECHERFYELWSPSHHGKAMQPVNAVISQGILELPPLPVKVGDHWYDVKLSSDHLTMIEIETRSSTHKLNQYEAKWALGGRNIFYFLTEFEGGRLQTMPLAYDINRKEWYSTPGSAVRHFVDNNTLDDEIDWKHSLYTFNTTCHSCHVSQLQKNYDIMTNTYHTTWKESGINCETCHGPSEEHVRICREAALNEEKPKDLKIISAKSFTPKQHNASCASCHAKGIPLTQTYVPGEPFFQHFNLVTLENPDYYPDGRDLGENYTMTSWLQSSCVSNSNITCITCHTSSGRYRYKNNDNEICASCHADNARNFEAHSHHELKDSLSCVSCHLPKTEFARMTRSDHSMRPPTPATTMEFQSPNACNNCHVEETAEWANNKVIEWYGDYQDKTLDIARLIFLGRNGNFQKINEMLEMINDPGIDIIFRNSMIRILTNQVTGDNLDYFLRAMTDNSPLIRASAAGVLGFTLNDKTKNALMAALSDSVLIVRNRASMALAVFPRASFSSQEWALVEQNFDSYEDFLMTFPDTWSAHYNLGNYYYRRGMYDQATKSYEKAIEFEDEAIIPLVNAGMTYSILGNNVAAEENLLKALALEPDNASANLNYGLLLAQFQRFDQSKKHLEQALKNDSSLAVAAYNLAVISAKKDINKAINYISIASMLEPDNSKYSYTWAFFAYENGDSVLAITQLKKAIDSHNEFLDAYLMLASIYEEQHNPKEAIKVYKRAYMLPNLPVEYKQNIQTHMEMLRY